MIERKETYTPDDTETFSFFGRPHFDSPIHPIHQFARDLRNVFINSRLIGVILSSIPTERNVDELYLWAPTVFSLLWFTFWSIVQVPFVLTFLVVLLITAITLSVIVTIQAFLIWRPVQGPQLQVYPPAPPKGYNRRQRWVYINGVATGKTITRQNLQLLSQTFHQPILAINNRTYGFLGDILECMIQRAFNYRSKETGITYLTLKSYLVGPDANSIDNVVLVAHSQGGIIASQVLDDLYRDSDISRDDLTKLEIYTFGSAALTFNNPWFDSARTKRVIPVMEHYCNQRDMVTSWGALLSTDRDDLPFIGKVFVHQGQTGHLLNQHYLKHMFVHADLDDPESFLCRVVEKDSKVKDKFYVTGRRGDEGEEEEEEGKGEKLSVKGLSKLWTYMVGKN